MQQDVEMEAVGVEAAGQAASVAAEPKRFVAHHEAGLGPRISTIVNVRRMAELTRTRFAFSWAPIATGDRDVAAVPVPETVFGDAFVAEHLLEPFDSRRYERTKRGRVKRKFVTDTLAKDTVDGLFTGRWDEVLRGDWEKKPVPPSPRAVFAALPLPPVVGAVLDAAPARLGTEATCLHVRRRLVRDSVSAADAARMAPLGVLDAVAAELRDAGKPFAVAGDDPAVIDRLRRDYGAIGVADLTDQPAEGWNGALADIALMASCRVIVSSGSDLARAAAAIGGGRVDPIGDRLDRPADGSDPDPFEPSRYEPVALAHMAAHPELYDAAERVRTHALLSHSERVPADARIRHRGDARRLDPRNDLSVLDEVLALIARGDAAAADALIGRTANGLFDEGNGRRTRLLRVVGPLPSEGLLAALEVGLASHPGAWLFALYGEALGDADRHEEGYEAARRALAREPDSVLLAVRLGEAALRARHREIARDILARVVAQAPGLPVARDRYADALLGVGNPAAALAERRQAVALAPEMAIFAARCAWQCMASGHPEEADRLAATALANGGSEPEVLDWVARLEAERGNYAVAVQQLLRAEALADDPAPLRVRRQSLQATLRQIRNEKARQSRREDAEAKRRVGITPLPTPPAPPPAEGPSPAERVERSGIVGGLLALFGRGSG